MPAFQGTNPGRTHRFYTGKAVVPFGFGLSYTTFTYTPSATTTSVDLQPVRNLLTATYDAGRTFPSRVDVDAAAPLVSYNVKVCRVTLCGVVWGGAGRAAMLLHLHSGGRVCACLSRRELHVQYLYVCLSIYMH